MVITAKTVLDISRAGFLG